MKSFTPLKGMPAKGVNDNPLMFVPEAPVFIKNELATTKRSKLDFKKTYTIDLETEKGKIYEW